LVAVSLVVAAALSLAVGFVSIRLGRRWGLIDRPDQELKPHEGEPVPLGGLGLLVGLHTGLALAGSFDSGLLAATLTIWVVGLVDDTRGLSPFVRLAATALVGWLLVGLTELSNTGVPDIIWILAVVVVVNAVNLLDGLDALAGSVALVAAGGLGVFALVQGIGNWWAPLVISAALVGFLVWNRPSARLYLGDNGAYVVAVTLTWSAMLGATDTASGLVALALIGVPLLDLGVTILRRLLAGTPLFAGDRDHSYDQLARTGRTAATIAALFAGVQVVWSGSLIAVSALGGDVVALIVGLAAGVLLVGGTTMFLARSGQES
jgi:UDP-GlcNAc:undecaprenyl-phosphate GlcNAc-1-phosphate transferase